MSKQQYSDYTAYLYEGEEAASQFPGLDDEPVAGDPFGQCSDLKGKGAKIETRIKNWIDSRG